MNDTIGFIGLGVMGYSMARNILKETGQLYIWNRTASKCEELVAEGAIQCDSPEELAKKCSMICICVSDTPDVESVLTSERGLLQGLQKGSLVIDFSTISAEETRRFSKLVDEKEAAWLDAPVSGGDIGAREGTLSIMVGGSQADFDRASTVFKIVGKNFMLMGPSGSGQLTKLANQIAVAGTLASMSEMMVFAKANGMDVEKVVQVVGNGAAGSWSLQNYGPRVLDDNFAPGFSIELMSKDYRLVEEAMNKVNVSLPTAERFISLYREMVDEGLSHEGVHAVIKKHGWQKD